MNLNTGDCIVGHIDHGNSRRTPTVGEGEQLFWQCDFDFVHDPGNGESVCQDGTLVPPPQCRQSKYKDRFTPVAMLKCKLIIRNLFFFFCTFSLSGCSTISGDKHKILPNYSPTCLQRPLMGRRSTGLCSQVLFIQAVSSTSVKLIKRLTMEARI